MLGLNSNFVNVKIFITYWSSNVMKKLLTESQRITSVEVFERLVVLFRGVWKPEYVNFNMQMWYTDENRININFSINPSNFYSMQTWVLIQCYSNYTH